MKFDLQNLSWRTSDAARRARQRPRLTLAVVVTLVALLTILLRTVNLSQAYDIFLDEVTYLFLSESVAQGTGVRLHGETFYLHPPAFFYLEGAYVALLQPTGDLVQRVYDVRTLNVLLAGVSAALIFLAARLVAGNQAGLLAALVYALDPLGNRMASRNLLEISAVTWVLAGLLVLLPLATEERHRHGSWWRIALTGVFFGLAILTKDMMIFLTLVPLGACFLLRRCLPRSTALSIGLVASLVYAVHPLSALVIGDWPRFLEKKTRGLSRLVGLVQETGFNRPVGPGLLSTVSEKLGEFGSTYLLFALGALALAYLWLRADVRGRLVAIWAASAYLLLAYLIPWGTLETQFFYYLLVPALLTTGIAASLALSRRSEGSIPRWLMSMGTGVLALIILWSVLQWVQVRFDRDNGYEQVLAYVANEIPREANVASTSETGQFLLDERASGPWGSWYTVDALAQYRPDYLVVSQRQLEWDYGELSQPLLSWLEENGQVVFSFEGRTNERLFVVRLQPALWPAP